MNDIHQSALNRWPEILITLGGIDPGFLVNKHGPCPLCGGKDRFRFDDKDGSGSWLCGQCGGKHQQGGAGNGLDLLMRKRQWDFKTAVSEIERHLGIDKPAPTNVVKREIGKIEYLYSTPEGQPAFKVIRTDYSDGSKKITQQSWDPTTNTLVNKGYQGLRPLYRLHALTPDQPVLITEGEKCADFAAQHYPQKYVSITWAGGSNAISKSDWSPLTGRTCILWPDNDKAGRKCMNDLAAILHAQGCTVKIVKPPLEWKEKDDIADHPELTEAYFYLHVDNASETWEPQSPTAPFRILGRLPKEPSQIAIYINSIKCIQSFSGKALDKRTLISFADIDYWLDNYPKTANNKDEPTIDDLAAANDINRQADNLPFFDADRERGRGVWTDAGSIVMHLGNCLVIDGKEHNLDQFSLINSKSHYVYTQQPPILGPSEESLSDADAQAIVDVVLAFPWEDPAFHAQIFLGWIALAPFCAALSWRPHIWLNASKNSGKSEALNIAKALTADMSHPSFEKGTTEAGIRQKLGQDAFPVIYDEFETNVKKDKDLVDAVLNLVRSASGTQGMIVKGSPTNTANSFVIRSMFCFGSINLGIENAADMDRIVVLRLSPHRMNWMMPWTELSKKIDQYCNGEMGRRLISRTFKQFPVIQKNIETFRAVLAEMVNDRYGRLVGTLLAGAYSFESDKEITREQAVEWIQLTGADKHAIVEKEENSAQSAEKETLTTLLQWQLPLGTRQKASVYELVSHCFELPGLEYLTRDDEKSSATSVKTVLRSHGIVVDKNNERFFIHVRSNKPLKAYLQTDRDSAMTTKNMHTQLLRLPGVESSKDVMMRTSLGVQKGIWINRSTIEA